MKLSELMNILEVGTVVSIMERKEKKYSEYYRKEMWVAEHVLDMMVGEYKISSSISDLFDRKVVLAGIDGYELIVTLEEKV